MSPDLLKTAVRGFGLRLVQLDAAVPGPLETADPNTVPQTANMLYRLPRILIPVLAAAVLILILCRLSRRRRQQAAVAEAEVPAEAVTKEEEE